jgi:hypothetical protein
MIQINEEKNNILYYNVDECVKFCQSIPDAKYSENIDYHIFWNVGLPFERKQTLPIKSFLCTQNLEKSKFNLWSNVDLTKNEYVKPFLDLINVKIWNPIEESKGTPLEGKTNFLITNDRLNYCAGDLFRVLVLHNYGGLYTDVDVVFLRDFGPILDQEFMYKWSYQKEMINGAVMRMFKKSKLSYDLLNEMSKGDVIPGSLNWSTELYEKVRKYNKDWTIFPSGFFNTEWQIFLSEQDRKNPELRDLMNFIMFPFKKNNLSNQLYDGVFSWHWHNGWNETIEEGSKWEILESKFNNLIYEKFKIKI